MPSRGPCKRGMKRFLSLLMALCMLMLASCATAELEEPSESQKEEETQTEGEVVPEEEPFYPVLRFVAASDTHVKSSAQSNSERLSSMIRQLTEYAKSGADGYDRLDAIAVSGDITDTGAANEFAAAKKVFNDSMDESTELVITTGNHDWSTYGTKSVGEFEKYFGAGCAMKDEVIGGYHFITLVGSSAKGTGFSKSDIEKAEKLISDAIQDTGKDRPVFVFQHIGNLNTAAGTCTVSDEVLNTATTDLIEMQSKYENLVVFSGHSHFPSYDECSVYQGDFTAINAGCLYYAMTSMVNRKDVEMPDIYNMCQCLLVEMDAEGRMRIRCWDVLTGRFVGKPWLIESWSKEEFQYTADRFSQGDLFFAEGSRVTVEDVYDSGVYLSFPSVPAESLSGRVYEIQVTDQSGTVVATEYVGVEYFNEKYNEPIKHGVGGLLANTEYTASVRAVNSLYSAEITDSGTLYSQPISVTFRTAPAAARDGADLIDVWIDAGNRTITNAVQDGMEAQVIGSASILRDQSIGRDVIRFTGSSGGTVRFAYSEKLALMKDSMSFEAYFKIDSVPPGDYFSLISAQQSGGFGLDAQRTGQMCKFHFHDGSAYRSLGFKYEIGVYYHLVAVYDGSIYTLYVNGEKIGSVTIGEAHFPGEAAQFLFMGGDTNSQGNGSVYSNCTVATFRLYSYALTEAEAKVLYNNR